MIIRSILDGNVKILEIDDIAEKHILCYYLKRKVIYMCTMLTGKFNYPKKTEKGQRRIA